MTESNQGPDLIDQFCQNPCGETYLALRKALIARPDYDMYSRAAEKLEEILESKQFDNVKALMPQIMPQNFLNPKVHMVLSKIGAARNNDEMVDMEAALVRLSVMALKETGDGTRERPFYPMFTSDEYLVVHLLDKQPTGQQLVNDENRTFDVINCTDGTKVWFDITDCFAATQRRMS